MARRARPRAARDLVSGTTPSTGAGAPPFCADFASDAPPSIHVSARASALLSAALAREGSARYVRVRVGRLWSGCSYRLALDESAGEDDVVIEAAGLRFVAERLQLPLVSELRVDVETRCGRGVLVLSHPTWTPRERC